MLKPAIKKLTALLLALLLFLSFAACRRSETPSDSLAPEESKDLSSAAASEPASEQEESSEPVSEKEPKGVYLISKRMRFGDEETYEYNDLGQLTVLRYGSGVYVLYDHDENGNLLSETSYGKDGKVQNAWSYEYNEKDLVTKETYQYKNEDPVVTVYEYRFDDAGRTVHIDKTVNGKTTSRDYTYSENGEYVIDIISPDGSTAQEKYTSSGVKYEESSATNKSVYTYDDQGRMISWILYDELGAEIEKCLYIYEDGKATTEVYSSGSLLKSDIYYYDENGNNVKVVTVDGYGKETVLSETEYIYFIPEK